jgi:hypothetical protein
MFEERSNRGLMILIIIIAALVISNVYIYMNLQDQITGLVNDKNAMQTQIDTLQAINTTYHNYMGNYSHSNFEYKALQLNFTSYVDTHSYSNSQYDALINETEALNDEIDALKAAKLIKVNFGVQDTRPLLQTPYLIITGEVCNVGFNVALNCRIHIIAKQGLDVALDTYIILGEINGESWISFNEKFYYSGSAITDCTANLEWS